MKQEKLELKSKQNNATCLIDDIIKNLGSAQNSHDGINKSE